MDKGIWERESGIEVKKRDTLVTPSKKKKKPKKKQFAVKVVGIE